MLYIVYDDLCDKCYVGIRKKILAQVRVFSKKFERVFYTSYSGQMLYLLTDETVIEKELAITWQECYKIILGWIIKYSISKTYIRYNFADRWFIEFLKEQKRRNIASVLEFPTFPYEGEVSNKRSIMEDRHYRTQISEYIDRCTTYTNFDEIFGITSILLLNGVDIEEHPARNPRKKDGSIVLLAVAAMAKWHGYERVIEGMAQYYEENGKKNILFKLVGDGPEIGKYKSLVQKYGLETKVEFCGKLEGKALDMQYDESDIAIGSLGMYKTGLENASPIKMREYYTRGLPIVYGYEDLGFQGNEEYLLRLPNNSEPVDMLAIIQLFEKTAGDSALISKMHEDAGRRFSWDRILAPVIDYYN